MNPTEILNKLAQLESSLKQDKEFNYFHKGMLDTMASLALIVKQVQVNEEKLAKQLAANIRDLNKQAKQLEAIEKVSEENAADISELHDTVGGMQNALNE